MRLIITDISCETETILVIMTWSDGSHDSSGGFEHGLVDSPLVCCELAVGWKGAGDVRGVTIVLSSHVKQTAGGKKNTPFQSDLSH